MKKISFYRNCFFLVLLTISVLHGDCQQQFTQVASKKNNYCNHTCTLIDVDGLNKNPGALIYATPIIENGANLNPHPIGIHYINEKWSIINLDQQSMPEGSKFNVWYYLNPDPDFQFVHTVNNENLKDKNRRSYIDHKGLNNQPRAQFQFIPTGIKGGYNLLNLDINYDNNEGRWFVYNNNGKAVDYNISCNIFIGLKGNAINKPAVDPVLVEVNKDVTAMDTAKLSPPKQKIGITNAIDKSEIPPKKDPKIIPATDLSKIRICIEKGNGLGFQPGPPTTSPPAIPTISSSGEIIPVSKTSQGLTGASGKMWPPGSNISVGFIGGGPETLIKKYAKEWEKYANIKFSFIQDVYKAQVRVGFDKDGTFWSYLGWDANENPVSQAQRPFHTTMNFGWKETDTPTDMEIRSMTLHEFGHALGFIHEFNPSAGGIPWDQAKLNSLLGNISNGGTPAVLVETNHFHSNSSNYDPSSIMRYFYPATLTTDGSSTLLNTDFSATDKAMAAQFYPFPSGPQTQRGDLHTGDDCDDITFSVEYNVVNGNVIEFILEPGRDANNNILTWWKKIAIPVLGNGEVGLEIQDGNSITKSVAAAIIDKNRGIRFGKAKALGVHTGLSFTWNAWPAIIGGCRVRFKWIRDKCP